MPEIAQPDADIPITDRNGVMSDPFQRWVNQVTRLDLIVGTGSPEGVIEAGIGREYIAGVGRDSEDRLLIILDIDKLLGAEDLESVKEMQNF